MDQLLALHAGTVAILVLGACALVILVFIVIAPWRAIRDEPPLSDEAETRLLLGEDFEQVDEELREEHPEGDASVSELRRGDRHE